MMERGGAGDSADGWATQGLDQAQREFVGFLRQVHQANGGRGLAEVAARMGLSAKSKSRVSALLREALPADVAQAERLVRAIGGGDDEVRRARKLYENAVLERGRSTMPQTRRLFDHLIQSHIALFAGRVEETRQILNFLRQHDRGYVFIEGLSGYGKTSLLANLVHQHSRFLYHFISQSYKRSGAAFDPTQLGDVLSNLCEQLEPGRATPSGGRCLEVRFIEAMSVDRAHPVTVVLDAVDEVDRHPNYLRSLLPKRLPRNVFVILSARSQGDRCYLSEVGLSMQDVALHLWLDGLDEPAIAELLTQVGPTAATVANQPGFVARLHEVSGGDPFYLRFLVEDVERGLLTVDNIDRTPSGLAPYLEEQLLQLNRSAHGELHVKVLGLILAANGALHRSDLLRIACDAGLTGLNFDDVLRDIHRFLLVHEDRYTFCHPRFKEFFASRM